MRLKGITPRLRTGLHAYRQLGPWHGTAAVVRHGTRAGQDRVRRLMLERHPLRVSSAELLGALGGAEIAQALTIGGDALPSVRRWASELPTISDTEREGLLTRADDVVAHRFNLLGSGPTELGPVIDWHRDFKTGRRWPVEHISRVPVSYPDSSDIKVPWELSRFQHLPLLAAAHRISPDRGYLEEIEAQLGSWIAANPVEFGVNWSCTMDVAIRGVNWVAAVALCADDASNLPWMWPVMESLLLHARFIRSHLEYGSARGNHYLSDVVGLLVISAVFSRSAEGRAWTYWAVRELSREMRHQVRADGCDHEASISYHRLVTELFIVGADAASALVPGALDPEVRPGLDRMLGFVADYTRPDGLAPQIGDADDGRLLPLGDYAAVDQRSHLHLFRQAGRSYRPATESAAYRDGGFYILRTGDLYGAVRCGDVGIYGRGCHAHNDLMAFELAWGATPLIVDPGSYLYTADPVARNRFRSTAVHSALQLDGAEQNELRVDRLFSMVDRAHTELVSWEVGASSTTLTGRHRGFEALPSPATYTRTLTLDGESGRLEIIDRIASDASHQLSWALPLATSDVELVSSGAVARFPGVVLRIEAVGLHAAIENGWISPAYGQRYAAAVLRVSGESEPGRHQTRLVLALERECGA